MAKKSQKPAPEVITIREMEADVGAKSSDVRVNEMPAKEKAAYRITIGVGLIIALVIVFIGYDWLSTAPPLSIPKMADVPPEQLDTIETMIENYKTINGLAVDRAKQLFDLIVVKALLPIFTSLLGFLFGTQVASERQPAG